MNSKITLYSDKELIAQIKEYAKQNGSSVSTIVNNFFKILLSKEKKDHINSPKTDKLYGIFKDSIDKNDYKEYLEKKYL